jgi:hypothetical protein
MESSKEVADGVRQISTTHALTEKPCFCTGCGNFERLIGIAN